MFSKNAVLLPSLLGSVLSLPASDVASAPHSVVKRNPCDGVNASPVLNHIYGAGDCPPPIPINSDGTCGPKYAEWGTPACETFCELSTEFSYAQEVPFTNTYCHYGQTCSISEIETTTVTINLGFTAGGKISEAYNIGVSGGVSSSRAKAVARTTTVTPGDGVCGYFTFVPVQKQTCGYLTQLGDALLELPGEEYLVCGDPHNYNICGSQPWRNADGTADGETIFVKTNCATREPLPSDQQDPVYQQPGVPLDRGDLNTLLLQMKAAAPPAHAANYSGVATTTLSFAEPEASVFDEPAVGAGATTTLGDGGSTSTLTGVVTITSAISASGTVLSGTYTPSTTTTSAAQTCTAATQCPTCPAGQCQTCLGTGGPMYCLCSDCS